MARSGERRKGRRGGKAGKEEWIRRFWKITRFFISSVDMPHIKLSDEQHREHRHLAEQARRTAKR